MKSTEIRAEGWCRKKRKNIPKERQAWKKAEGYVKNDAPSETDSSLNWLYFKEQNT